MEPIAFLKYVRRQDVQISSEFDDLKELESMIYSVRSVQWEGTRHAQGYHGDISDKLILLERKRAAVAGRIASHLEAWERAERIIERAGDERARLLLYYRFILGYPWDKIQKRLGIAASQVHCIKRDALRAVAACH